jgi:hypothetical protein
MVINTSDLQLYETRDNLEKRRLYFFTHLPLVQMGQPSISKSNLHFCFFLHVTVPHLSVGHFAQHFGKAQVMQPDS